MNSSTDYIELPDGRRITSVRLFIHSVKLHSHPLEWSCTIPELMAFAEKARSGASTVEGAQAMFTVWPLEQWSKVYLNPEPNEEDCAFCRAMPTCPSVTNKLQQAVDANFQVVAEEQTVPTPTAETPVITLNEAMLATGLLEDWIKAVRAEVERRLLLGEDVPDFGLELGRKGNKEFKDDEEAENLLRKTLRLKIDQVFSFKLKTPTQLEKLTKPQNTEEGEQPPVLSDRQWKKVSALIQQADPKPSVKLKSVIKTPYVPQPPSTDAFAAVPEDEEPLY